MEHFEYVKDLVGIDHVTFGPEHALRRPRRPAPRLRRALSTKGTQGVQAFNEVEYVRGIENPTEGSKNILRYLVREGYSDADIAKVIGQNVMRVLRAVW